MLAMSIRHSHPHINVACWAYACPPCVSLPLARSTRSYIYGVAFGDDVIVRLCFDSLATLKRRLYIVSTVGKSGLWKSWTEGLAASSQVEQLLVREGYLNPESLLWEREDDPTAKEDRLWAPSRQLYLYKVGSEIYAEECTSTDFHSIIIS
jgi:hypothetical protein